MASRRTVLKFDRANLTAVQLLCDRLGRAELRHIASLTTVGIVHSVRAAAVAAQMDIRSDDIVGCIWRVRRVKPKQ
jgi:hypothetical protein